MREKKKWEREDTRDHIYYSSVLSLVCVRKDSGRILLNY